MQVEFKDGKFYKGDELSFLKEVIENAPASIQILEVNKNGGTKPVWINKQYQKFFGYNFKERDQLNFYELYHPDDFEVIKQGITEILNDPVRCNSAPFRTKCKDGSWRWFFSSVKQITIGTDRNYILAIMLDIDKTLGEFGELVKRYADEITELKKQLIIQKLTKTEQKVVQFLIKGKTVKEIAFEVNRSSETINNHKRNIFKKLAIKKTSELICLMIE